MAIHPDDFMDEDPEDTLDELDDEPVKLDPDIGIDVKPFWPETRQKPVVDVQASQPGSYEDNWMGLRLPED